MREKLYKTTGAVVSALIRLIGLEIRVTGLRELPDRPVLFVSNHFTRFETFLVPYVIYRRFDRPVRSLATHLLFHGTFGRLISALGVLSVRDPARNRTIVGELMTRRYDWVIYPEGGLVKNKLTTLTSRRTQRRGRQVRRPRTGAALMALKAEIYKQRYLDACRVDDRRKRVQYERRFNLGGPETIFPDGTVIVPLNITYPRLRAGPNVLHRIARLLHRRLDPRIDEELRVEGNILFGDRDVSVHVGDAIEVRDFLDRPTELVRRAIGRFRHDVRREPLLGRQARRLTDASMRSIYRNVEINFDHLFCYGLRASRRDKLSVRQYRRALYVAAVELRGFEDLRLHPMLRNGIIALDSSVPYEPLESIERLAVSEGVIRRENGSYVIDRDVLHETHDLHEIRLKKMVQVIANEIEPIDEVVKVLHRSVNTDDATLEARLPEVILAGDVAQFRHDYEAAYEPGVSRPASLGEPFFLEAKMPRAGVILAHGYLACPEQMRPMAERLHAAGYSVYGVRLDGHGTSPGQLNDVAWDSWLDSLVNARAVIRHRCPRTILGGFSLGGVLATLLAARLGDHVDGLFVINPPFKLRHRLAPLVPALVHGNSLLRRLHRSRDHSKHINASESPELNYPVNYLRGTRELRHAARACQRRFEDVTTPTLIIQADEDPVVRPVGADLMLRGIGSRVKQRINVHADRHVVVRGEHEEMVTGRVLEFLERLCD